VTIPSQQTCGIIGVESSHLKCGRWMTAILRIAASTKDEGLLHPAIGRRAVAIMIDALVQQ